MAQRRGLSGPPSGYVIRGEWPEGDIDEPSARAAQEVALRLASAMDGRSLRAVGDLTGVNHTTVRAILIGDTWPDFVSLDRLSTGLGVDLWPRSLGRKGK